MLHKNNPYWREIGITSEQGIYRTRFLSNVEMIDGLLGCWIWRYGEGSDRYGKFWMGKPMKANRAAYALWFRPLRDDEHALHICDVTNCCNPWHLYAGTHEDNMNDRQERGRSRGRNSKTLTIPPKPWSESDFWRFFAEDDLNTVIKLLTMVVESAHGMNN